MDKLGERKGMRATSDWEAYKTVAGTWEFLHSGEIQVGKGEIDSRRVGFNVY